MNSRAGMTLMELVIGLVITGMMAMVGASAFGSIIDHRQVILRSTADVERAASLRETLHGWLMASTIQVQQGGLPTATGGRGRGATTSLQTTTANGGSTQQSVTAAAATGDELDFTTTAPTPAGSPTTTMRLFIDGDDKTPETGLALEYQASAQRPLLRIELEPAIGSMTVEYLDSQTNRWYPASSSSGITPRAVRLTLGPAAGYSLPPLLLLPMTLPMGQQRQPGQAR